MDQILYDTMKTIRILLLQDYKKELNKCYDTHGFETCPKNSTLKDLDIRYIPYSEECVKCVYDYSYCKFFNERCPFKCECISN